MKRHGIIMLLVALVLTLSACGGGGSLGIDEIIANSADAMSNIDTLQFVLERQGEEPAQIDIGGNVVGLLGASGRYQAPDSAYAVAKVDAGIIVGEAEILYTADGAWFTFPPLISSYTEFDPGDFNLSSIFTGEGSISDVMVNNLSNPTLVGEEDLEGVSSYHITAEASTDDIASLVGAALTEGQTASVDLWIATDGFEVVRLVITEESGSGWLLDLFGYGDSVEIPSP